MAEDTSEKDSEIPTSKPEVIVFRKSLRVGERDRDKEGGSAIKTSDGGYLNPIGRTEVLKPSQVTGVDSTGNLEMDAPDKGDLQFEDFRTAVDYRDSVDTED